jgi:hypothetical protein
MRYEVHTAVNISMLLLWVVAPCGLLDKNQRFGGMYCLQLQDWSQPQDQHRLPLSRRALGLWALPLKQVARGAGRRQLRPETSLPTQFIPILVYFCVSDTINTYQTNTKCIRSWEHPEAEGCSINKRSMLFNHPFLALLCVFTWYRVGGPVISLGR